MSDKKWRNKLELLVEENLNELLKETKEYNYAISKAKDKGKAQIWIALALLNHKINSINIDKKDYQKKIPKDEMADIIEKLEKL